MTKHEQLITISGTVIRHDAHIPFPCDSPEKIEEGSFDASEVKLRLQIDPKAGETSERPRIEEHIARGPLARTLFEHIQLDAARDINLIGRKVTIGYDPKNDSVTMTEHGNREQIRTVDLIQFETPGGVRVIRNSSKK